MTLRGLASGAATSSAPDRLSNVFQDARMTAGTSTTDMPTRTSAMPSTPKAMCTPKALIQVQLPWNWNRAAFAPVSNRKPITAV